MGLRGANCSSTLKLIRMLTFQSKITWTAHISFNSNMKLAAFQSKSLFSHCYIKWRVTVSYLIISYHVLGVIGKGSPSCPGKKSYGIVLYLLQRFSWKLCNNCAFCDKNTKFGTEVENHIIIKSGYHRFDLCSHFLWIQFLIFVFISLEYYSNHYI